MKKEVENQLPPGWDEARVRDVRLLGCGRCAPSARNDGSFGLFAAFFLVGLFVVSAVPAQTVEPAPAADLREGPFPRLILRGATLVDGTGAPPRGPVDVVIEGDRIAAVVPVGVPGVPIDPARRPALGEGGREIELGGAWVLPGFVDGYGWPGRDPAYAAKLWLAHGITTVREPICELGIAACLELVEASASGELAAPRIVPWLHFGVGRPGLAIADAQDARAWVREAARAGAKGIKLRGERPEVMAAAVGEADRLGLPTSAHLTPLWVARGDALDAAGWGVDVLEHWYGLPEAMLEGAAIQDFGPGYNWADEGARFAQAGRLWRQAAAPGSERWEATIDELVARGVALMPTFALYEANRDVMRARRAEWHDEHTMPWLWRAFQPSRSAHAAHFFAWTSEDEVAWRENYRLWMRFVDDFAARGGRVVAGSDAGFQYLLYGFGFVRELELLREAGLSPLEVLRAATLDGAAALGLAGETGSVEPGKLADLLVVEESPLADLKVLYGTGAVRLGADGALGRVGGVRWTIVGGVVHDAKALLAEVRREVAAAKAAEAEGAPPAPGH